MKLAFVLAEKAEFPVAAMCRILGVSRSGVYACAARGESHRAKRDRALMVHVRDAHIVTGQRTYGSPRVYRELRERRISVGRHRIARLMRSVGLWAKTPRRFVTTTVVDPGLPVAPNIVRRAFSPSRPNQTWASDITYVRTAAGWMYLAVILDLFSRKVVGWATSARADSALTMEALAMALRRRSPPRTLIHHSDRGCQYSSEDYQRALRRAGIRCSMSRKGNCWDNAVVESFFATIKTERLHRSSFPNRAAASDAVFDYVENFYNPTRRHSTLGYLSPNEYERRFSTESRAA